MVGDFPRLYYVWQNETCPQADSDTTMDLYVGVGGVHEIIEIWKACVKAIVFGYKRTKTKLYQKLQLMNIEKYQASLHWNYISNPRIIRKTCWKENPCVVRKVAGICEMNGLKQMTPHFTVTISKPLVGTWKSLPPQTLHRMTYRFLQVIKCKYSIRAIFPCMGVEGATPTSPSIT